MKLKAKFILPLSISVLIIVLISGAVSRYFVGQLVDHQLSLVKEKSVEDIKQSSALQIKRITPQIEASGQFAASQAVLFAGLPAVTEAMQAEESDRDAVQKRLEETVASIDAKHIRIIRKDGSTLIDTSTAELSDRSRAIYDIAASMQQSEKTGRYLLTRYDRHLMISGYSAIPSEEGDVLGLLEIAYPFEEVLKRLPLDASEHYGLYLSDKGSFLELELQSSGLSKQVPREFLKQASQQLSSRMEKTRLLTAIPLQSSTNEAQAILVLSSDMTRHQEEIDSASRFGDQAKQLMLWTSGITVIAVVIMIFIVLRITLKRYVLRPLNTCVDQARKVSGGDFTQQIDSGSDDEFGLLISAFNSIATSFNQVFMRISNSIIKLSSTSNEMSSVSKQVLKTAERTSENSQSVASASEEMSSNMNTVAAAGEEASANIFSLSNSANELNSTISLIAENTKRARGITENAVSLVTSSSDKVDALGTAVKEIGQVTDEISAISEKTDLLALNATIEAARAGAAGKGFAVVANEVKTLSHRTASSTMAIQKIIKEIQQSTNVAVDEIKQITGVIKEVNEIVSEIAQAVDEQSMTTSEMAENVRQAAQGIDEVAKNVGQSSSAASEIAREITQVSQATHDFTNNSSLINASAQDLAQIADNLKQMMESFKTTDVNSPELESEDEYEDNDSDQQKLIEWEDSLMVHIPLIDAQHQQLVKLINQLHRSMKKGKSRAIVGETLQGMIEYTTMHFKTEEELMESCEYPRFKEHQAIHEKLVEKVLDYQQRFQNNESFIAMDVMEFLKDWLINHIKGTDSEYAPHLRERLPAETGQP